MVVEFMFGRLHSKRRERFHAHQHAFLAAIAFADRSDISNLNQRIIKFRAVFVVAIGWPRARCLLWAETFSWLHIYDLDFFASRFLGVRSSNFQNAARCAKSGQGKIWRALGIGIATAKTWTSSREGRLAVLLSRAAGVFCALLFSTEKLHCHRWGEATTSATGRAVRRTKQELPLQAWLAAERDAHSQFKPLLLGRSTRSKRFVVQ
jgi:hypothetical protein